MGGKKREAAHKGGLSLVADANGLEPVASCTSRRSEGSICLLIMIKDYLSGIERKIS